VAKCENSVDVDEPAAFSSSFSTIADTEVATALADPEIKAQLLALESWEREREQATRAYTEASLNHMRLAEEKKQAKAWEKECLAELDRVTRSDPRLSMDGCCDDVGGGDGDTDDDNTNEGDRDHDESVPFTTSSPQSPPTTDQTWESTPITSLNLRKLSGMGAKKTRSHHRASPDHRRLTANPSREPWQSHIHQGVGQPAQRQDYRGDRYFSDADQGWNGFRGGEVGWGD